MSTPQQPASPGKPASGAPIQNATQAKAPSPQGLPKIPSQNASPAPTEAAPLSSMAKIREGIKQAVIKGDFEIPALPTVAQEVMKLTNNPNAGMNDIEKLVKNDQAMTARIIRTANSPFYRGVSEITTLQQAMGRIGMRALKDIVISLGIQSQTFKQEGFEAFLTRIWDHSVACAAISQDLGKKMGLDADVAFLSGLMHDIGKTIIIQVASKMEKTERMIVQGEFRKSGKAFDPKKWVIEGLRENILPQAFIEFHAVVGSALASRWMLPEAIAETIKHHDHPEKASEAHRKLVTIVHLANVICEHAGLGTEARPQNLADNPGWEFLGIPKDQALNVCENSPELAHKLMGFM